MEAKNLLVQLVCLYDRYLASHRNTHIVDLLLKKTKK